MAPLVRRIQIHVALAGPLVLIIMFATTSAYPQDDLPRKIPKVNVPMPNVNAFTREDQITGSVRQVSTTPNSVNAEERGEVSGVSPSSSTNSSTQEEEDGNLVEPVLEEMYPLGLLDYQPTTEDGHKDDHSHGRTNNHASTGSKENEVNLTLRENEYVDYGSPGKSSKILYTVMDIKGHIIFHFTISLCITLICIVQYAKKKICRLTQRKKRRPRVFAKAKKCRLSRRVKESTILLNKGREYVF